VAAAGMALFGTGWVAVFSLTQATAQLVCPSWVRARALAIYQLSFNGALTLGSVGWGVLGGRIGLSAALLAAAALGGALAITVRAFGLDTQTTRGGHADDEPEAGPEAPAPELAHVLARDRARVLETMPYRVTAAEREAFLAVMAEVRRVRRRAGAVSWGLYEDVAHPDGYMEAWAMESWTDHLREHDRLSADDRAALARAASFQAADRLPARFIAVDPAQQRVIGWPPALPTPYRTRTEQGIG
ncbi:MAG: MFS transporter, partial [Acetobacteraceae bacterium]